METVLLDLGAKGQRIRLVLGDPQPPAWDPLRSLDIEVDAAPFGGTITTLVREQDADDVRQEIKHLAVSGRANLLGGRAPAVMLVREGDVVEVTVQASGDDPWPTLRYLIFE